MLRAMRVDGIIWLRAKTDVKPQGPSSQAPRSNSNLRLDPFQLCERAGGEWLLRFVPDITEPGAEVIEELRQRLIRQLGISGKLVVQQTDLLVPESSGKFRLGYPLRQLC
jgi:hypothetical protein